MPSIYNNFGVSSTPIGEPTPTYSSFGVVNSNMNGLSTIANVVTESVSPNALSFGLLTNDLQSANFSTGVSGWRIRANGDAEFQSLTGLTFTGVTITGATISGSTIIGGTFKTSNTSTRVEINGTDNALYYYNSGNITLGINGTGIFFNNSSGVASGSILGLTANSLLVTVAGAGNQYSIGTSALEPYNGQDLGSSTLKWGTVYATVGTINTSDIRIKTNVTPLDYGLSEVLKLNPIRYDMKEYKNRLGFSAQAVSRVIPEATSNCEDTSEVGTAGLCPTDLIPVLVNAIKELKAEVDKLREMCYN